MSKKRERPTAYEEPESAEPWLDRRELGKLLRLIGPLIQIPLIWLFLRNPEFAQTHTAWIYGGMTLGLMMVLAGILLSARKIR